MNATFPTLRSLTVAEVIRQARAVPAYGPAATLVAAAEVISQSVTGTAERLLFTAEAAVDILAADQQGIPEAAVEAAEWILESAESIRPTPAGSTEMWGSVLEALAQ
jgi:hypothetical protein